MNEQSDIEPTRDKAQDPLDSAPLAPGMTDPEVMAAVLRPLVEK